MNIYNLINTKIGYFIRFSPMRVHVALHMRKTCVNSQLLESCCTRVARLTLLIASAFGIIFEAFSVNCAQLFYQIIFDNTWVVTVEY